MLNITDVLNKEFKQGTRADDFVNLIRQINNGSVKTYDYIKNKNWTDKQLKLKDSLEDCESFSYPYTFWSELQSKNIYPSQHDFISDTYKVVKPLVDTFIQKNGFNRIYDLTVEESNAISSAVAINRIARAYISFVQEDYAIKKMLDLIPNITVYTSSLLDRHFGIDFVVVGVDDDDELQTFNIHTLKDSESSKMRYMDKAKKTNYPLKVEDNKGNLQQIHVKRTFENDLEYYYPQYLSSKLGKKTLSIGDLHLPADYLSDGVRQNLIADIVTMEVFISNNKHEVYEQSVIKKVKDLVNDLDLKVTIKSETNI